MIFYLAEPDLWLAWIGGDCYIAWGVGYKARVIVTRRLRSRRTMYQVPASDVRATLDGKVRHA